MRKLKSHHSLFFFSVPIFCLATLPRLLSWGRFLDGQIYASIARNLANGLGSFWKPYYTDDSFPVFFEHPPLGLYLQSLAFRIFGDVYCLEAVYGFFLGLMTLVLIALIWRVIRTQDDSLPHAWLPVLFFSVFPIISWMTPNNMLENTLTVFVLTGAFLLFLAVRQEKLGRGILFSALAGLALVGAFLTKGFPGLFPLALPLCVWLVFRKSSFMRMVVLTAVPLLTAGICLGVTLATNPNAMHFFRTYLDSQVVRSLSGGRETAARWSLAAKWLNESLVPWALGLIIWGWKRGRLQIRNNHALMFTLLVGLCGSLPLLLSPKQMGWYLAPSMPFFAMAYAALFGAPSQKMESALDARKRSVGVVLIISGILFAGAVTGMLVEKGKVSRNREFYQDFVIHPAPIPERIQLSAMPESLRKNYGLLADLQRHLKVSLTSTQGLEYAIAPKEMAADSTVFRDYHVIHPDRPEKYVLLRKVEHPIE